MGDMYDHLLEQTLQVADLIQKHDDFELLAEPSLSTVLFRAVPNNEQSANGVLDSGQTESNVKTGGADSWRCRSWRNGRR